MKTLIIILCSFFTLLPNVSDGAEKLKDIRKRDYPQRLQQLTISASSPTSYEDAMNRLARMQPDGYVIESLNYSRLKGNFTILAKLRKIKEY